jgi:hypothetical protein
MNHLRNCVLSFHGIDNTLSASQTAKLLFQLELNYHKGDAKQTHECIKNQLGTSEKATQFYNALKTKKSFLVLLKDKINRKWSLVNRTYVSLLKNILKIAIHLCVYSWDFIKDVYFLIAYTKFFPVSRNPFNSFGFQIFLVLLMSILIPNVLNLIVILTAKLSLKGKVILGSFSMLSQPIIAYTNNRLQIQREREKNKYTLEEMAESISKLDKLQSRLRINESIFESSIQAIVLLIATALNFR